ncbi:MAG: hypothetical protein HY712_07315 [candidate division NC10 bacterium]|nr:hypothetical protein [candidate division NC10 bacterium]
MNRIIRRLRRPLPGWRSLLAALLLWPVPGAAATAEEALVVALQAILAPGEGHLTEALYASPNGATSEGDLPLVARARYTFKRPRVRVELTDAAGRTARVLVHDGTEARLVTPLGANRLAEAAPEVRRDLSEQLFPIDLGSAGTRLVGSQPYGNRTLVAIEGRGPDGPWAVWLDPVEKRILSFGLRRGDRTGELTYGSGGVLRKVVVRNAAGRLVLVRYRDLPTRAAIEDATFNLEMARAGGDLGAALSRGLTPGRSQGTSITATAGARGVDEEVQRRQLGKMRLDYEALAAMEGVRVSDEAVERFLRAGRLGRYRE